jgi:tRNA/tmRNA/rRNA uracil-C5-methylase (TrmA/RlmC/RlmD family)
MARRRTRRAGGFNSTRDLTTMFPAKDGVDYSKLKLTEEGEYSITKPKDGERLLKIIKAVVGNISDKHITDLTGNVGGDTILFGLNFHQVDSIEYNKENYDALENNVKVFGLSNVKLHFGDSTEIYDWYTDILYIDAPWGGPDYKDKTNLDLFLGDLRLDTFLREILRELWRPKYIFLKLPRNYNFGRLETLKHIKRYQKYTIRGYNCVALETK